MVHPAAGFGMWPNVQKNLESASVSFQAVRTKLGEVLASASKSGGFFGVNRGAWKLGLRVSSLAVYRERLRAHHMAFRIGASMMRLYVPFPYHLCHGQLQVVSQQLTSDASALRTVRQAFEPLMLTFRTWRPRENPSRRSPLWASTRRRRGNSWT
jgi:hypothetical protein